MAYHALVKPCIVKLIQTVTLEMLEKLFGDHLKQLRKECKITQEQLAEAVGVDVSTVKRWEKGAFGPDFDKLELIAHALGVSVSGLFVPRARTYTQQFQENYTRYKRSRQRFEESKIAFDKLLKQNE